MGRRPKQTVLQRRNTNTNSHIKRCSKSLTTTAAAAAAAKSLLQARTLEWVAISFSNA